MKKELAIILLAFISLLASCGKAPFSNGEEKEFERRLDPSFNTIDIGDNFNVTLLHSDSDHPGGLVRIKTGENLIDGILTEVDGDTLVIRNNNGLGFLRPYDYTREITVYYDTLFWIKLNSNADCIQTDTLRGYIELTHFEVNDSISYDSLVSNLLVEIKGGSGDFNILTNCYKTRLRYLFGTSNLHVKGVSEHTIVSGGYDCHGVIDCSQLESKYLWIEYDGTNAVTGKAIHTFSATNNNIGVVHYIRYYKTMKKINWGHFENSHWIPNDTIDTVYYCPIRVIKKGVYKENITSIHDTP